MIKPPAFIRHQPRLAFYAFTAVAASGFGQTFFVSVMGGELRQAFGLSHTVYGSLYSGATVLSAALLLRFGALADRWSLTGVTTLAVAVLAACMAAAVVVVALIAVVPLQRERRGDKGGA